MSLPKGFFIGASTAAHQVEGNNVHSDYWLMEHMEHSSFVEPSGEAVDHYHRYEEDIKLMAQAGLNAYRFSIEWARIEPEKDRFDDSEIEHYRKVIRCCKENGLTPIVTLMHFTSPAWLIREGGWESEATVERFKIYCEYVVDRLGDELEYVATLNEANMGLQLAALMERFAKQAAAQAAESQDGTVQVGLNMEAMQQQQAAIAQENLSVFGTAAPATFVSPLSAEGDRIVMRAHEAARDAIKAKCPHLKVGLTLSLHDVQVTEEGGEPFAAKEWDEEFLHYLPVLKKDDFFGVQNYTRSQYGKDGIIPVPAGAELTQMNYEYYPQALEHVIRKVRQELDIPLLVTENGVATADDTRRVAFIQQALEGVQHCVDDGIPVIGYCHWSLLDNFEWQMGYRMTFGLIAVDRTTQERHPKESLRVLGSWAQ